MSSVLTRDRYGKGQVRLLKMIRHADRTRIKDLTVDIHFEGDFTEAYAKGDNRCVLPTDTMKNTVYALAKDHPLDAIEAFGQVLSAHFLTHNPQVARVEIALAEHVWHGIPVAEEDGTIYRGHPHAFFRGGSEVRTCAIRRTREALVAAAGLRDLHLLKTKDSGFAGFLRDRFTTLRETHDRLLGTTLTARWAYAHDDLDFNAHYCDVRQALLETFARHESRSVQHTLHAMGSAALEACADVTEINLSMPNKHRLLVDLAPFEQENANEIFMPVEEPFGVIEATLKRA